MKEDINDNEIRVIGHASSPKRPKRRPKVPWWAWVIVAAVVAVVAGVVLLKTFRTTPQDTVPYVFEPEATETASRPLEGWFASLDTVTAVGTAGHDTVVNDIPLRIYVPLNGAIPRLELGYNAINERERNILVFQAADIRADNYQIVGAFVLHGKPLSWGLSKKGYCAIIDDRVTIGVAENSPLFELATEKNGYFFRQYPLVDNGKPVENELKNKAIRRALCDICGRVAVIASQTPESFHDFTQALVDVGVQNAIYLVGGTAIGWSQDLAGNGTKMGLWDTKHYKNTSFIVWSK